MNLLASVHVPFSGAPIPPACALGNSLTVGVGMQHLDELNLSLDAFDVKPPIEDEPARQEPERPDPPIVERVVAAPRKRETKRTQVRRPIQAGTGGLEQPIFRPLAPGIIVLIRAGATNYRRPRRRSRSGARLPPKKSPQGAVAPSQRIRQGRPREQVIYRPPFLPPTVHPPSGSFSSAERVG